MDRQTDRYMGEKYCVGGTRSWYLKYVDGQNIMNASLIPCVFLKLRGDELFHM